MNIHEYQKAMQQACTTTEQMQLLRSALLGFLEECGEMVEPAKVYLLQRHPFDLASFQKEIGVLLWYLSQLCGTLGIMFADELQKHIERLQKRPDARLFRIKRRRDPV